MRRVGLARVSLRRSVTIWAATVVGYVGSLIGGTVFVHSVSAQPSRAIGGIGFLVLGPILVALRFGRPPLLLIATLVPIYYIVVALSVVSEYDEPRWSYSRIWFGVFDLLTQFVAAAIAHSAARQWRSLRSET